MRRVHDDAVRAWIEVRLSDGATYRSLGEEIQVGKSSVEKFVKRQAFPGRNWHKLKTWYVRQLRARYGEVQQDPSEMARLMLDTLAELPSAERAAAARRMAEFYEALHREIKAPVPDWIGALLDEADRLEREAGG